MISLSVVWLLNIGLEEFVKKSPFFPHLLHFASNAWHLCYSDRHDALQNLYIRFPNVWFLVSFHTLPLFVSVFLLLFSILGRFLPVLNFLVLILICVLFDSYNCFLYCCVFSFINFCRLSQAATLISTSLRLK